MLRAVKHWDFPKNAQVYISLLLLLNFERIWLEAWRSSAMSVSENLRTYRSSCQSRICPTTEFRAKKSVINVIHKNEKNAFHSVTTWDFGTRKNKQGKLHFLHHFLERFPNSSQTEPTKIHLGISESLIVMTKLVIMSREC